MSEQVKDPCPSESSLDAFAAGRLSGPQQRALEPHLDQCPTCKQRLLRLVTRTSDAAAAPEATARLSGGPAPGTAMPLHGRRLGRYLILEDVGAGAMGVVYAAYDTVLDRKVALKFLTDRGAGQAPAARVLAEAAAMARLAHPNVVTVHDVGAHEGLTYLSMELVDGVNLATWRRQKPRSFRQIAQVMAAAARGLAAAHAAGIVHRDVKPQNILVAGGRVLVTDFGVAMRTEANAEGCVAGTPAYMAPEQFRGDRVDARTDVFGFSATLYEMLHGERPFDGTSREEVQPQVEAGRVRPPPQGSRVPGRLHRLALRGLDPDPARRPEDMNALADELLADPAARRRNLVVAGLAAVTVAVAFWGGGHLQAHPERQCRAGADLMSGAWNADRRAQLLRRYAASAAATSWPVLERRLDEYSGHWRAAYAETCSSTFDKRVISDEVFDLRVQCLNGQRATVEAFMQALSSANSVQLVRAAGAVLPTVAECQLTARPETKPRPLDPAARERITAIEQDIARSLAEQNLGDYAGSVVSGKRAVAAARQLRYEPLLAAALVRLATVETLRGTLMASDPNAGLPEASRLFDEAWSVAEVGHDDRQRLIAAREQVLVQVHQSNFPEARRWAGLAKALLARLGHPPADDSALALYIGRLHYFFGSFSDAGPFFRRAADLARKVVPVDHRHVALAEGAVCMAMEDWDQRIACSRKAVELAKAAFGPEHPEVGAFYGNLGLVLNWKRPHPPEACQLIRKGMGLMKGPDQSGPRAIKSLLNLAECVEKQGNVEEARRLYEEALSLNTTVASRALVLQGYSLLLAKHLDLSAGLARAREAVAAYESTHGPGSDDTVVGRTNVAMMLADTGRLDEALQELDESIAQCRKQGTVASGLGHLHGYRAEILAMMKRPEAALRSAEEGMRVLRELAIPDRELGVILHAMAVAHLQLGQVDEAVAKLERALQLREETVDYADTRADLQFALARALVRKGRDRARACDLARKAATTYGLYVRKRPQKLDSERWLTRQGCAVGA